MRKTKLALLAAAFMLPMSMQAGAADAITEAPPEPPVANIETAPAYLWAGGYGGVFGGYSRTEADILPGATDNAFLGGVYGGYNWQFGNVVVGAEADAGISGTQISGAGATGEQDVFGSLRARLGYDLNPFMVYATGGVAASKVSVTDGVNSDDNVHYGYTVGAGAEAFVTERITTRLEYRYTDYAAETYNLGGASVSSGFDDHSVRAGIGIKF